MTRGVPILRQASIGDAALYDHATWLLIPGEAMLGNADVQFVEMFLKFPSTAKRRSMILIDLLLFR